MTQAVASTVPLMPGCLVEVWAVSRLRGADPTEAQVHGNLLCGQPLKDTHSSGKGSKELRNQTGKQKGLQLWTVMPKMSVNLYVLTHNTLISDTKSLGYSMSPL